METLKLKGLESLGWRADHCKVTSVSCRNKSLPTGEKQSAMLVEGTVVFELRKSCGVCFTWQAQQQIGMYGATGKFDYSVNMSKAGTTEGLVFEDEAGEPLPVNLYSQVVHRLARDTVTNWSNTVSHLLKSYR